MKLNNKGLTVVELILCFVLLIILVFSMFNVVVEIKDYSETKELEKDLLAFKNRMIYLVQEDLITYGVKSTSLSCPNGYKKEFSSKCLKITFNDNTVKYLIVEPKEKVIKYGSSSSLEEYKIPHSDVIEFLDESNIGLCVINNNASLTDKDKISYKNKKDCETSKDKNGVKKFIWIGKLDSYQNITFTDTDSVLTIDVPYFEIDGTVNYGFKIIHPYNLK